MRLRAILLALLVSLAYSAKGDPVLVPVTFVWDLMAEIPDVFTLYVAATPDSPPSDWKILQTVPGLDTQTGRQSQTAVIPMPPGKYCFYLTASNLWGESEPSNVVCTPYTPARPVLRIR